MVMMIQEEVRFVQLLEFANKMIRFRQHAYAQKDCLVVIAHAQKTIIMINNAFAIRVENLKYMILKLAFRRRYVLIIISLLVARALRFQKQL
jgi:hypothetical protein